jgi:glutaredoxin
MVVFSKTYCPYCTRAKSALKGLLLPSTLAQACLSLAFSDAGFTFELIELDTGDGKLPGEDQSCL